MTDGAAWLPAVMLVPAALALAARGRIGAALMPWAPVPALALALSLPVGTTLELPWLLLGSVYALDASGRSFLIFTALVWLLAGWFARAWLRGDAAAGRFRTFFLATQAGNLGLCLAQDAASFYLLFALMTFAAYGLIVHAGDDAARRAGRVYLVMALFGEVAILIGLLLAASGNAAAGIWPLLIGFGVKVGLPLLHVWLPLAHPVAPVPASAVLSGVMLKAGLLGWLRFLPLGETASSEAGMVLVVAGLAAMLLAVGVGLTQRQPKVVLAYSSVSQMGFMTLGVGAGLLAPASWPMLLAAVCLYASHHALAKSALFLGVGLIRRHGARPAYLAGLALPALALAGAPLTSGFLAKAELKTALAGLDAPLVPSLVGMLPGLLALAALGSTLLMARLFWLLSRPRPAVAAADASLWLPWAAALLAVLIAGLAPLVSAVGPGSAWATALWPFPAAAALAWLAVRRGWRAPELPAGDVLALVPDRPPTRVRWMWSPPRLAPPSLSVWPRGERALRAGATTGLLWLCLLAAGFLLF